jgi:hypothetical protein
VITLAEIKERQAKYAALYSGPWAPDQLSDTGWLCLVAVPWLLEQSKDDGETEAAAPAEVAGECELVFNSVVDCTEVVRRGKGDPAEIVRAFYFDAGRFPEIEGQIAEVAPGVWHPLQFRYARRLSKEGGG